MQLSAQRIPELGLHAVATFERHPLAAVGLYGALRFSERGRVALTMAVGGAEGAAAFRGEILGHLLFTSRRAHGVGVYGLGGLAWKAGRSDQGYLVLGLGVEARPGTASGWAAEFGVGGGLRAALGYRWRWLPPGRGPGQ
jgi:hypothetical protein